jgi:hypothetical protein
MCLYMYVYDRICICNIYYIYTGRLYIYILQCIYKLYVYMIIYICIYIYNPYGHMISLRCWTNQQKSTMYWIV